MILIYSKSGDLAAFAPRIDGTLVFVNPRAYKKRLYAGMAPVVGSLGEGLRARPEAVLFDMVGDKTHKLGIEADTLRRRWPVWGAGAVNDLMENNRAWALSVFLQCGIRIPKTVLFDPAGGKDAANIDLTDRSCVHRVKGALPEARRFVAQAGGRWVLKPHGNEAPSLSYVARDPDDMDHRLAHAIEKRELPAGTKFLLQQFISGVEVSTEVAVCNGEIIGPANATIETKKFLAGDLGSNTGCQTSVVYAYSSQDVKIMRKTIGRREFRAWLKHPTGPRGEVFPSYHAMLDLNCIVSEEDQQPYALEPTVRFGYNAIYAHAELLETDLHDFLVGMATGKPPDVSYSSGFAYCLRVSIPPYPHTGVLEDGRDDTVIERMFDQATHVELGGPIENPHVWLLDAQQVNGHIRTAGFDGVVLEVSGRGQRIEEARDAAHAIFEEIRLQDKQARTADGADRAIRDIARLQAWGYEVPGTIVKRPAVTLPPATPSPDRAGSQTGKQPVPAG